MFKFDRKCKYCIKRPCKSSVKHLKHLRTVWTFIKANAGSLSGPGPSSKTWHDFFICYLQTRWAAAEAEHTASCNVKEFLPRLQHLLIKRKKRPDISRTRQQTLAPPGFIRKVTKDGKLITKGTPQNTQRGNLTQVQIRLMMLTCFSQFLQLFFLIILCVKHYATTANMPLSQKHSSGQDVTCLRVLYAASKCSQR